MTTRLLGAVLAGVVLVTGAFAQGTPRRVKVLLEFQRSGESAGQDVQGAGSVVIRRSGPRGHAGLGGSATTTRTRRSTGIFTLVEDGGSSMLSVGSRIPYEEAIFYRDYATGAGYAVSGIGFENVGTALRVSARVRDGDRIHLRLTPTIRELAADGTIELTEAATELTVRSGEPVVIGGATADASDVTWRILGLGSAASRSETTLVVTATLDPTFP